MDNIGMERFIENAAKGREEEVERMVNEEWLREKGKEVLSLIHHHLHKQPDLGPYTGASGILLEVEEASRFLSISHPSLNRSSLLPLIPPISLSSSRFTSYLGGCVGDLTVLSLIGEGKDVKRSLETAASHASRYNVPNEVLYGRAGILMADTVLRKRLGSSPISSSSLRNIIDMIVSEGKLYSMKKKLVPPLMWEWHDTEYLGAAHGVAGILHALLLHWNELLESEKKDVKETAMWLLSLEESKSGHWESSTDHVGSSRSKRLVHCLLLRCHGAPGTLPFLLLSYHTFTDESFLDAALRAGELIWEYGVLKKGPGLCHGIGGNGIAMLSLYTVTRHNKWRTRAKCFAYLMMDDRVRTQQRTPDAPHSLFEGWAGGLSLLIALSQTDYDPFPLIPLLP